MDASSDDVEIRLPDEDIVERKGVLHCKQVNKQKIVNGETLQCRVLFSDILTSSIVQFLETVSEDQN